MLLRLSEIKTQCRLDDDDRDEDSLLALLGRAAEARVIRYISRQLYAEAVPDTDPDGRVLTDDIRLAMLQLVSHWYENRSPVSDTEQAEVPMSFRFLVDPYRFIPL